MRRAQDWARSATIELRALGALKLASEARDENVPAKRADFLFSISVCCEPNIFGFSAASKFQYHVLYTWAGNILS